MKATDTNDTILTIMIRCLQTYKNNGGQKNDILKVLKAKAANPEFCTL